MKKFELLPHLKSLPEDTIIEVFGAGEITSIQSDGNKIRLVAESKASTAMEAIKQLKSTDCYCGKNKQSAKSFCLDCYRRLPAPIQKALYNRIGNGYEEAYKFACRILEGNK